MAAAADFGPGEQNSRSERCERPAPPHLPITQARTSSVCLPGAGLTKTRTTHMAVPRDAFPPMSTIAWSHHMAGDARPSLEYARSLPERGEREDDRDPLPEYAWSPDEHEEVPVIMLQMQVNEFFFWGGIT